MKLKKQKIFHENINEITFNFPSEILILIFLFIKPKIPYLLKIKVVCKQWYMIIEQPKLWTKIYLNTKFSHNITDFHFSLLLNTKEKRNQVKKLILYSNIK